MSLPKTLILDIETTTDHNTIWLCCCEDLDKDRKWSFTEPEGLQQLIDSYDSVAGHNIIGFDAPVLARVWNVQIPDEKLRDTLILSMLYNPELKHSLAAWGHRLGFPKGDFTDYDGGLCPEMVQYCEQDVAITKKLYKHLNKLLRSEGFSEASEALEHAVALATHQQELNGFRMDTQKATELYTALTKEMRDIREELQETFPPIVTERWSEKTGKRLKDGVEEFNPNSDPQIVKRLQGLGVKFKHKTDSGAYSAKEKYLEEIGTKEALLCIRYKKNQKMLSFVNSWFEYQEEDGRIYGKVITNGAVTGRMTHNSPNMGQIPKKGAWGSKCRECFTVEEGNILVGIDASGLELRMLAHYMRDEDYTKEVAFGDVHTRNMEAAGLTDRDDAKTFIYAFLYGAQPTKLGSIIGGGYKEGNAMLNKFLKELPKLSILQQKVDRYLAKGALPGLDGRLIRVRSSHAILNTLLQGAGAVVMKKALVILTEMLYNNNIEYKLVANVHDEFQIEAPEYLGEAVGICGVQAIKQAGVELGLRCPLDAEYKIGRNWSETH